MSNNRKNAPRSQEEDQIIWDALFIGKIHVEDLLALEAANESTGFKPGALKKELSQIESAMKIVGGNSAKASQ